MFNYTVFVIKIFNISFSCLYEILQNFINIQDTYNVIN